MILDFTDYKFRASSLGKIMTGVKGGITVKQSHELAELKKKQMLGKITDKQLIKLGVLLDKKDAKPELSQTVKTYLDQLHKEEVFGKRNELKNKYLDKGIQCEELSISLYCKVTNQFIVNNKTRKENDYLTGESDNAQKIIREFKTSWDLSTFPMYEDEIPSSVYEWQCQAYMELWDMDEAELIYCLVDSPEGLIIRETFAMENKLGLSDVGLPAELQEEIRVNMTFDNIPEELRVKIYEIKRDKKAMSDAKTQIKLCREYMNEMSEKLGGKIK